MARDWSSMCETEAAVPLDAADMAAEEVTDTDR